MRSCVWAAPGPVTTTGRIRVVATDSGGKSVSDVSNANYTVVTGKASITVTMPNTAVKWALGSDQLIKWNHNLWASAVVKIEVSRDSGVTWSPIASSVPNKGSYLWRVTGPATASARIRVSWAGNAAVQDASNVNFSIAAPFITIITPNGGQQWKKGSTQTVTWTSNLGSSEFVKIDLSTNGGATWLSVNEAAQAAPEEAVVDPLGTLVGSTPSDGSQKVVLPVMISNKCRVRITWLENAAVTAASKANFAIVP